ncbi:MAG: glycosyltransferase family 39 protein [Bacteroidota bacterium]
MEARNFTTAREMVEFGNWLIPTMNGELRLEKPPLPTWLTAAFMKVFGFENIYWLRVPAALSSTLLIYYAYRFIDLLTKHKHQAFITACVTATSLYVMYMGRTGTWDIFCHSFMLMAIYYWMRGFKQSKRNYQDFILAGICLGLSFMSKGPISFYALLLPFLLAHLIFYESQAYKFHSKAFGLMIIIGIAISFAWPLYIYYVEAGGAEATLDKETTAWFNRSTKPFWHYWSFPIQSGLWTTFFIHALIFYHIRERIRFRKEYRLLFWWTILSVFFLSLVPEKKERYLLPVLIPGAMIIGFYFQILYKYFHKNKTASLWIAIPAFIHFGLIALISIAIPFAFYFFIFQVYTIPIWQMIGVGILFPTIGAWMIYQMFRRDINQLFFSCLILICSVTLFMLPYVNYFYDANPTFNDYSQLGKIEQLDGLEFYSQDFFRIEMVWETGRRVGEYHLLNDPWPSRSKSIGFFSIKPIEEVYSSEDLSKFNYELIDIYDNNRFPSDSKKYKQEFRKHFYVLSRKL